MDTQGFSWAILLGIVWQKTREPKAVPNWFSNLLFGLAALGIWTALYFNRPGAAIPVGFIPWTNFTAEGVMWAAMSLGFGTASADVGVTGRTNSR